MHLTYRNVNDAFAGLVEFFRDGERFAGRNRDLGMPAAVVSRPSRNGKVLLIDEPVTITYTHPRERILFNAARDANPFSLLYESLWMLAGRNDVAPLAYYTKQFAEYSDDGKTLNGAYGHRWRGQYGYTTHSDGYTSGRTLDQLRIIIDHLRADPNSRRAVLQMWNVEDDLLRIGQRKVTELRDENNPAYRGQMISTTEASKDVCCNLSVMFSLRTDPVCPTCNGKWTMELARKLDEPGHICPNCGDDPKNIYLPRRLLDITVTNRSNDMVWGLLGANYVTFTVLQEYMAARLGCEVGLYHHFTNNLHVYDWNWKPDEWLAAKPPENPYITFIYAGVNETVPLVRNPATFDEELPRFVEYHKDGSKFATMSGWQEPFLDDADAFLRAFHIWKNFKDGVSALRCLDVVKADDWKIAGQKWIRRRMRAKERGEYHAGQHEGVV